LGKKILWFLDHFEDVFCTFLLIIVTILMALNIFGRYLNFTITGSEELVRFVFVYMILTGLSFAAKYDQHIRVDILTARLPSKIGTAARGLADCLTIFFCAVAAYASIPLLKNMFAFEQRSPGLQINFAYLYLIIPISLILVCFRILQNNYRRIKKGESVKPNVGKEA
jgi:TRAP-type C4-dicarboxylate transport system permease small subunit